MKKRGRKAGSGSFIQVSLEDLNRVLKPNARVMVWGKYAQMLGLTGKLVEATNENLIAAVHGGTTEVELETFGQNDVNSDADFVEDDKLVKVAKAPEPDLVPKPSVSLEIF
jgi:hypothetical protein